jgi:uncharacterized lipoprotein YddW (UPF0748 family)
MKNACKYKFIFVVLLVAVFFANSASSFGQNKLPKVQREFRAVWIATVDNIDFPSSKNLTTEQQKAELIKMLDLAQLLKYNAVIFQVRPQADAFYDSKLEPWSEYLTGEMGKRPASFFDPLKFAVDEAHKRGILLHAWFNPYRARHPAMKGKISPNHIAVRRPDLVKKYGKYLWLDPGNQEGQNYSLEVIKDVVRRYDIDGVHFDDYFYPYPEKDASGKNIPFPDEDTYQEYLQQGAKMSAQSKVQRIPLNIDDWRRANVDNFIKKVGVEIKKIKPQIMYGISPFGIWQPVPEKGIVGLNSYAELYADSRKWFQDGTVDYLAPQLYWTFNKEGQKFPVLLDWWNQQNTKKRHLWIGIATYRIGATADNTPQEIVREIEETRKVSGAAAGTIHFSFKPIQQNKGDIQKYLRENVYQTDALIPETKWIKTKDLPSPIVRKTANELSWSKQGNTEVFQWIFYRQSEKGWSYEVLPIGKTFHKFTARDKNDKYAVVAVDRLGNESVPTFK